jgi:hypothetical protein
MFPRAESPLNATRHQTTDSTGVMCLRAVTLFGAAADHKSAGRVEFRKYLFMSKLRMSRFALGLASRMHWYRLPWQVSMLRD